MVEDEGIIEQNVLSRGILFEVILTVVFISFGLNLIVASFTNLTNSFNLVLLVVGLVIVIISVMVLIYSNFQKFNKSLTLKGFFVYDAKENKLIDVENYGLSNELIGNLNSAFVEDSSLQNIWDDVPLRYVFSPIRVEDYATSSKEIIEECLEYYIFQRLSTTLHYFFNNSGFNEKDLNIYERDDIPGVLLCNRFLNLFSMPIDQREPFKDKELDGVFFEEDGEETLFMTFGKGGALYHRLHLVLPSGTNVKRNELNGIVLESNQMVLTFDIIFEGFNTLLPASFQKYYLDLDLEFVSEDESNDVLRFQIFDIGLKIDVRFKLRSLFSKSVWKYTKWLDKYLNILNKEMSKDKFFESINWEQIQTLLYIQNKNRCKEKNEPKKLRNLNHKKEFKLVLNLLP